MYLVSSVIDEGVTMSQEEIIEYVKVLAKKYDLGKVKVKFFSNMYIPGAVYLNKKLITLPTNSIYKDVLEVKRTICHEISHLIAHCKDKRTVNHNFYFQQIEKRVCLENLNITLLYARQIGYVTAVIDNETNEVIYCNPKYEVIDGKLQKKKKEVLV